MRKSFMKKLLLLSVAAISLQTVNPVFCAETKSAKVEQTNKQVQNSTTKANEEKNIQRVTEESQKDKSPMVRQIEAALDQAEDTLTKQIKIPVDEINSDDLEKYYVTGPLVPYIRYVTLKKLDDKTLQADINYTTWYQAVKAYKEPKLYGDKISEEAKKTLAKAKAIIKELKLEKETSAYAKEKAIHDYIIGKAKYSEVIDGNIAAPMHGAEGVILEQDGMCRSYAESMQLFMELLGVESKIVMGWSKKSYDKHVWNQVKLDDGNWYYVDLTWDEAIPDEPGKVRYDYFNITYRILAEDHELEEWQVPIDTVEMNYFPYNSIIAYCTEDVVDIIKGQLSKGKKEGEVYINYPTNMENTIPLVLRAMESAEVYGKVRIDKKTEKLYAYSIYE